MFSSDELVFVWPIGKALLVVIGSVGILVYAAWIGTKRMASGGSKQESDAVRVGNQQPVAWQRFSVRDSIREFISLLSGYFRWGAFTASHKHLSIR
jgi:hypothetical protein